VENTWSGWKDFIYNRKIRETNFEKVLIWQDGKLRRDKQGAVLSVWSARVEKEKANRLQVRSRSIFGHSTRFSNING
jgi:hypothetical protein